MWSVFHRKTQITIIVTGAIVIVVALQTIIEWITGSWPSALKLSSVAIFILATLMVGIFNFTWRWLWRKFPVLGRTIFPDLNGTWKGTLQTTWKDPNTGLSPGPIETTVWIRQDLLSFSVKQQTKESPSWSTRGGVRRLVGIEVGVVSGVFNLESPGVSALGWRLRHEEAYHAA
jgi:hypothetical protein